MNNKNKGELGYVVPDLSVITLSSWTVFAQSNYPPKDDEYPEEEDI